MSKGVLTVVSGFSGAGKGTVMKRLLEKYENYALSISVTTRNLVKVKEMVLNIFSEHEKR